MLWTVLKTAVDQWFSHRSARLGAALAYYSVFSIGPLLLIVTAVAGFFFGAEAVRGGLSAQFQSLLGETGSKAVEAMLAGASAPQSGRLAGAVGVLLLIVAALGVVVQLKDAMNTIWEVEAPKDSGVWWYVRTYLVSFAGILGLGFMLVISLVVSAGLAAISQRAGATYSSIGAALDLVASIAVLSALFAMLFKLFPDTDIAWHDVIPGAVATAALFTIGKLAIGWYVGTQALESTYGAAASIVVLLIWVYYSAQIVLFGAELTRAYAVAGGSRSGSGTAGRAQQPTSDSGREAA
jgi:membrane protein